MAAAVAALSPFLGRLARQHAYRENHRLKDTSRTQLRGLVSKHCFGDKERLRRPPIGAISWRLQFDRVGVRGISSEDWDACSLDASCPEKFNPFLTHGFLSALEETGCAVKETGWVPQHIIARNDRNNILGVIPLYLKRFLPNI
ncbi:uncharacterized protein LOC142546981 [Primulina tabacum]|uniref:uncharacterized protein LOC142546981 n=1 Tax=Primulina tabacum TaxID=48773 RepID=UPI003F59C8AF